MNDSTSSAHMENGQPITWPSNPLQHGDFPDSVETWSDMTPPIMATQYRHDSESLRRRYEEKMQPRKIKLLARAFGIGCFVELVLLSAYMATRQRPWGGGLHFRLLEWYHLPAVWFAQYILVLWNPGPRPGPTVLSSTVAWSLVFLFQVVITTPIIYALLVVTKLDRHSPKVA